MPGLTTCRLNFYRILLNGFESMMCKNSLLILLVVSCGCSPNDQKSENTIGPRNTLFETLPPEETGIDFANTLHLKEDFDVFRYRNYYNGGGVGIADFNKDGLADIYLTSNMGDNKLYQNKGDFKFDDITEQAGVKGSKIWSTGVSIADVNGDGLLDIYVCNAGDVKGNNRENELFVNNGDLTFKENAKEFGLHDVGFSTHAAFFDYDRDGDLDCYVLNNSYRPVSTLGYQNLRHTRDPLGGHKLYRNDNNHFIDVSENAGIYGSVIGFGLGVTVGDINQDNWPDLYISNDFYERDYLYINNHDGTFSESLEKYMGHISMFSMGADLADLDNDGYPEIFSTDMLPEDDYRLKTLIAFETYDVYRLRLRNGYYHQYMRNMLHRNNADGTFSEIGWMAGVSATDWSWGALIADFDNDQYKEIFVSNGIFKDLINQDFIEYLGNSERMKAATMGKKIDFRLFTDKMPSVKLSNYLFTRDGEWHYTNAADEWGLGEPGFSNGAAYGDLDNDGDLDLVVNNVNEKVSLFKNRSQELKGNNYLSVSFKGYAKNTFGLGASVKAFIGKEIISNDHMPIRGFQSSMDYTMTIGLGVHKTIDSLVIFWPDDKIEVLKNVTTNQLLKADHANAVKREKKSDKTSRGLMKLIDAGVATHVENDFNEFDRDRLLYHMLSTQGPGLATADLNGDGMDDFYLGSALGNSAQLYLRQHDGKYVYIPVPAFAPDSLADIVDAVFFDADGDQDLDLFAVTGGTENTAPSLALQDYYYENKGLLHNIPQFEKTVSRMPLIYRSGSCVRPQDFDHDGDTDLFVGTRVSPAYYGLPCDQYLLINDGKGNFSDATPDLAPGLQDLGMVTDAMWFDYDENGYEDLLIVGEWMPVTLFVSDGKKLTKIPHVKGLEHSNGWWNTIAAEDLDKDGDLDFALGNLGLNSRFRPTINSPVNLYVNDFDENGSIEPIFAFAKNAKIYPMALRQDIIKQMSSLKKKFVYYKDYAGKSLEDIFSTTLLNNATKLQFNEPHTSILINNGKEGFDLRHLPAEAQVSPVFAIEISDLNKDGHQDLILGGNLFSVKPEAGRYDALHGLVLAGNSKGEFKAVPSSLSGLKLEGEVRHIRILRNKQVPILAIVRNNDKMMFFEIKK